MVLSLPKILGLFALIWLVWMAFRFIEAHQKNRADKPLDKNGDAAGAAAGSVGREGLQTGRPGLSRDSGAFVRSHAVLEAHHRRRRGSTAGLDTFGSLPHPILRPGVV